MARTSSHDDLTWYRGVGGGSMTWPRDVAAAESAESTAVLVVEDLDALRATLELFLESLGYRALGAGDGLEALEVLDQEPAVELVIADLGLPRMDGRRLFEVVRARWPGIRFLFCTGNRRAIGSITGRGVGWVEKPFELDALATRVQNMLAEALPRAAADVGTLRAVAGGEID
jgi:DNA-binding response OmpR family regulator